MITQIGIDSMNVKHKGMFGVTHVVGGVAADFPILKVDSPRQSKAFFLTWNNKKVYQLRSNYIQIVNNKA